MKKIVISQDNNPSVALNKCLNTLNEEIERIKKSRTILLIIDTMVPEGNPSTINVGLLKSLINYINSLSEGENKEISILPCTLWGMNQKKILKYLGIDTLIRNEGVIKINFEDSPEFIDHIDYFDYIIILGQIKTDPYWGLFTALSLLTLVESPAKQWEYREGEKSYSTFLHKKFKTLLGRIKIDLVIQDCYYILEGNGPFINQNTNSLLTKQIVVSNSILSSTYFILTHFTFNISDHPLYSLLFDESIMEHVKIVKNNEIDTIPTLKKAETNPLMVKIRGLSLYLGEMDWDLKRSFLLFLYQLETILLKDSINLNDWAILVGKNPPVPNEHSFYIVFGDDVINQLNSYSNIQKVEKNKQFLEGDELEIKVLTKIGKYRNRMDDEKGNFELTLNEIIRKKPDETYRKITELEEEKKLKLKLNDITLNAGKKKLEVRKELVTRKIKSQVQKIKINKKIAFIPGNPPKGFDWVFYLINLWKKRYLATLNLYAGTLRQYYVVPKKTKTIQKQYLKQMKSEIKTLIKSKYKPLAPKVKKELKDYNSKIKEEVKQVKLKHSGEKKRIKKEYTQKINEIKEQKNITTEESDLQNNN